jgi:hypothetical protein
LQARNRAAIPLPAALLRQAPAGAAEELPLQPGEPPRVRLWRARVSVDQVAVDQVAIDQVAPPPFSPRRASRPIGVTGAPSEQGAQAVPEGQALRPVPPPSRQKRPGRDAQPSSPEPKAPEAACSLLVCFRYRLPNFPHSPACNSREWQCLGMMPDGFQSAQLLSLVQFVNLGCNDDVRVTVGLEPHFEIEVLIHPAAAGIQDQE